MSNKKSVADKCCVVGCSENSANSPGTKFYRFPAMAYKKVQREKWIAAVKKVKFDRAMQRQCSKSQKPMQKGKENMEEDLGGVCDEQCVTLTLAKSDCGTQVDFLELRDAFPVNVFICNRNRDGDMCEAETQCNISTSSIVKNIASNVKCVVDQACGPTVECADKAVGPYFLDNSRGSLLQCERGFHGFSSLEKDQDLLSLAGVNFATFDLLLKTLNDKNVTLTSKENRLLIFLFKMKLGLSYSSLGVLFGVHRTTASRIFHSMLMCLAQSCKNFIQWPSKYTIASTMPKCFKEMYPDCRVIIDCTEFRVEEPPEVSQRVLFYSHYKKGFTIKTLVGCTPGGLISFVSKCFGGRSTDAQITTQSGFLELLEPGDIILADKGFPQIKTILDEAGKNVVLVMPPFLRNNTFSADEVKETQRIASIRIHIERIMQRIKTFRVTSKLSISELPHVDGIVFMACVLVNLQPPIIKLDEED